MIAPVRLRVALVYPSGHGRKLDHDRVKALAASIQEIGLRTPITVRPTTKVADGRDIDAYEIVAGQHRYEAVSSLGMEEIDCIVSNDDDLHAELWEIDENLMRAELTPADRASCTARRKAIYEDLHPETKAGASQAAGMNASQGRRRQLGDDVDRFTVDTAKATGKSERAVQRDAERGERIADDVLAMVQGTPLDKGTYLDSIKKLSPEGQRERVELDLDRLRSAAAAERDRRPATLAPEPLNDFETKEKQVAKLMAAWNAAGREAREEFLERIDRPTFDATRAGHADTAIPSFLDRRGRE
jgi:ParB-like chromosome segregation protein Spo0J